MSKKNWTIYLLLLLALGFSHPTTLYGADAVNPKKNFFFDLTKSNTPPSASPENNKDNISQTKNNDKNSEKEETRTAKSGSVIVVNQRLKSLLEEFARIQNIDLTISENIKNSFVKSQRFPIDRDKFFEQISADFSLDYYNRGDEYFLSHIAERESRMIALKNLNFENVKKELSLLVDNIDDFTFEEITASNSIFVSGPPSFIALVELITEGMIKNSVTNNVTIVRYGVKSSADSKDKN